MLSTIRRVVVSVAAAAGLVAVAAGPAAAAMNHSRPA